MPSQACFEFCDHAQGKRALPGNILMATELSSQLPRIALFEEKQRQVLWTAKRRGPDKLLVHRRSERAHLCRIAGQHVETRSKAIHPMEGNRLTVRGSCPSSISGTLTAIENLVRSIEPDIEVVAV